MRLGRRALLAGGTGLASALVATPALLRLKGCATGTGTIALDAAGPVPAGDLCTATVSTPAASTEPVPRPLHAERVARFVDALPLPRTLTPSGRRADPTDPSRELPLYRVAMREALVQVHRDLPPTRMWTYEGQMPGPTLETRSGQGLLVEWVNELPERHLLPVDHTLHGAGPELPEVRAVVHVHGARAPAASDGYPEDWLVPGRSAVAHYPGEQDAATLWYHDHAMGLERLNQYAGLLGCFLVRDDVEESLGLPDRPHEIPLVLCDRRFDADGQLRYPTSGKPGAPWVPEVYADTTLVNGKLYPYAEVEAAAYRLRVVNASNSRTYRLSLGVPGEAGAAPALHQIGSDQGLLSSPVAISTLTLAPAERADLVVDLRGREGQRVLMRDQASELLELRVGSSPPRPPRPVPAKLRPVPKMAESEAARTRILTLDEYRDRAAGRMLMLLDGKYWHDPVSEKPELGSVEIWTLLNLTDDAHPIHVHLVRFQVLDRRPFDDDGYRATRQLRWTGEPQPPPLTESGWKDTAVALPGMATRLIMRFGGYPGRYVWHCHVLEHAANAMMRPFEVVAPA